LTNARIYQTEAVVLKSFDYGEADRILTLYTPQMGKVRTIAKGVRRTKSRKAGHLDLFTRTQLVMARGKQLDVITQADTLESFPEMRTNLARVNQAHYVAELVENFTAEGLANYPVYALTIQTLRRLASSANLVLDIRSFELQLLSLSGYRPQLHHCLNCDKDIQPEVNWFSCKLGGILCPDCASTDVTAPEITVPALKVMRILQTNESTLLRTEIGDAIEKEVEQRLQDYIIYRLEAKPRSIRVLERMTREVG
jgi:DNA repair protein RecO (recombination protein O)